MPAPVCVFGAEGEGPQEFVTVLVPRAAGAPAARVLSLTAGGAAHFLEIADGEARDFVILGRPGRLVAEQRFTTDFAWTWARVAPGGELRELILIGGGSRFAYGAHEVLNSPRPLRYAAAQVVGGELRFEAEPEGAENRGGADLVIDGGAFGLRDKLSKEGFGAATGGATVQAPHSRPGL